MEERLESSYQVASQNFNQEVKEVVEEVGSELQLIAELGAFDFDFTEQDSSFFDRNFVKIAGSIVLIAGTIFTFFAPGIVAVVAIGVISTVVSMISGLFKSRNQKKSEAVQRISESLSNQIIAQKETTLKKYESEFSKSCQLVSENIDDYFDNLSRELQKISEEL
uniref:hypothetical protein n=1 Tax=Okeania sp. SIO2F4 TaxID=2607790 RepID=UPI0025EE8A93|nr:hypothetical protein [Okeania sp. SIO2F4]